jgi:DNA-binding transcriptional regulator YdaS (Cro superfamily)
MNGLLKAIELAGTQEALAKMIGPKIKQGHISYWLKNGLPPKRAIEIEHVLGGQVTREELCPEIFSAPRPEQQVA